MLVLGSIKQNHDGTINRGGESECWGLSKVATVTCLLQLSRTGLFLVMRIVGR